MVFSSPMETPTPGRRVLARWLPQKENLVSRHRLSGQFRLRNATGRNRPLVHVGLFSNILHLESSMGLASYDRVRRCCEFSVHHRAALQPCGPAARAKAPKPCGGRAMNPRKTQPESRNSKRRYLVHLSATRDETSGLHHYTARIRPWSTRNDRYPAFGERYFADECALVEILNPLLPVGSDIRNVLGHIESAGGFLYLLTLSDQEAAILGHSNE